MSLIVLRKVSKSYFEAGASHRIFEGIDLSVDSGEFVVLLGRSGSGKSTLLNLVSGMDLPDEGEIAVCGYRLDRLPERERTLFRRHHVGFVFQQFNLIPTLTVLENVLLPLELTGKLETASHKRGLAMLQRLGLGTRLEAYPDRLSGGEQQRVAIARALIHDPAIILADEPTGNLDLETGRQVLTLLDGLVREQGRTLIMATHSREVIGLADRILTLHQGRLAPISE